MSSQRVMKRETAFLHVRATGTRTRETVTAMAKEILTACLDHEASRVVVDVRGLEERLTTIDAYEIPTTEFPRLPRPGLLEGDADEAVRWLCEDPSCDSSRQ